MTLTFLHGFLGSPKDWHPLNLEGKCLTLPGHHGRPLDLSLLEKEIPEKTILIGYSLGGRLAMEFAAKYPQRIEALIILSAHPGLEGKRKERLARDEKWARLLETEGIKSFLKKWYQQPLFKELNPDALQGRKNHNPHALTQILRELSPAKRPPMWDKLHTFSFPMLFLFGENDIKYQTIAQRLGKHFSVDFIPSCGHAIHIENPALCREKIQRFIGSIR